MPQFQRFKERSKSKVFFLCERVEFMIVALTTIERQSQKRFASMFDQILLPGFVIPFKPAANKISGGNNIVVIGRHQLIGG